MSYLYDSLARYGDSYALSLGLDTTKLLKNLEVYQDDWVQYNPRKNIPREGLSVTSLDGGLSGVPDLDSIREYNIQNNLSLDETSFTTKTEVWDLVKSALEPFKDNLGRTHIIKMPKTGCFPTHRDDYVRENKSFRLFLPIDKCNPPDTYFILNKNILNFMQGHVYFLDTCKEHVVFTCGETSMFLVANIILNEDSVDAVLNNLLIS